MDEIGGTELVSVWSYWWSCLCCCCYCFGYVWLLLSFRGREREFSFVPKWLTRSSDFWAPAWNIWQIIGGLSSLFLPNVRLSHTHKTSTQKTFFLSLSSDETKLDRLEHEHWACDFSFAPLWFANFKFVWNPLKLVTLTSFAFSSVWKTGKCLGAVLVLPTTVSVLVLVLVIVGAFVGWCWWCSFCGTFSLLAKIIIMIIIITGVLGVQFNSWHLFVLVVGRVVVSFPSSSSASLTHAHRHTNDAV